MSFCTLFGHYTIYQEIIQYQRVSRNGGDNTSLSYLVHPGPRPPASSRQTPVSNKELYQYQ